MKLLIINTLPKESAAAQSAIAALLQKAPDATVIQTEDKHISPCIGCNACWLKTPGVCAVKDDYEPILTAMLKHDTILYLSGTALDFVDYKMKNVIDRILPLATMYTCIVNGEMRHVPRYDKAFRFGLLYSGTADQDYLTHWMERVSLNMHAQSLGALPVEQVQEVAL